jgi:hypothetical protein
MGVINAGTGNITSPGVNCKKPPRFELGFKKPPLYNFFAKINHY